MLPFCILEKLCPLAAQKDLESRRAIFVIRVCGSVRKTSTITYHEHDYREAIDGSTVLTMSGVAIS
jgi:hypothetical protein